MMSFRVIDPTETLTLGTINLTQPSLVDSVIYGRSRDTILSFANQDKYHEIYRFASLAVHRFAAYSPV